MSVTKELVQNVRRRLAEGPAVLTGQLAEELEVKEEEIVISLPVAMRKKARAGEFSTIWRRMAGWQNVILYSSYQERESADKSQSDPFGGSEGVRASSLCSGALCNKDVSARGRALFERLGRELEPRVGTVWFVSLPVFGTPSSSVRLYDKDGQHILSVYLGRDANGELNLDTSAEFQALWNEFGVTPVPKHCCKGKSCSDHGHCACKNAAAQRHDNIERVA